MWDENGKTKRVSRLNIIFDAESPAWHALRRRHAECMREACEAHLRCVFPSASSVGSLRCVLFGPPRRPSNPRAAPSIGAFRRRRPAARSGEGSPASESAPAGVDGQAPLGDHGHAGRRRRAAADRAVRADSRARRRVREQVGPLRCTTPSNPLLGRLSLGILPHALVALPSRLSRSSAGVSIVLCSPSERGPPCRAVPSLARARAQAQRRVCSPPRAAWRGQGNVYLRIEPMQARRRGAVGSAAAAAGVRRRVHGLEGGGSALARAGHDRHAGA